MGLNNQHQLSDEDFTVRGVFRERSPALRLFNQALRSNGQGGADPAARNQAIVDRVDRERQEGGFGNGHMRGSGKPKGMKGESECECDGSESDEEMKGSGKRKHSGPSGQPPAKKPWLIKGSQEAKDRMRKLREMRGKK